MENETVGQKIKRAREKSGLTQLQLAKLVGTTSQNISQYERNIRKPKYETLQKIATALGVEWYSLFVADSNIELSEAQAVKLFTSTGSSVKEAQEIFRDLQKSDELHSIIKENIEQLNSAGTIAAGQLILSVAKKITQKDKEKGSNYWMSLVMQSCFSSAEEYAEVKRGIDLLMQIPAYQSAPQAAPAGPDDKEPTEK